MPLDTNAAFNQESRKREQKPIFLYTVYDYKGDGENLRFAGYDTEITYDGELYQKFPVTHDVIAENTRGEIDSTKVQLSNISRLIEYYLQNYDLRGKRISIKMVYFDLLNDPDAHVEFSNYVDSYQSDVKNVVFNLMSKFDVLDVTVPGRTFIKSHCQWIFKSDECGYTGAETSCNRTRGRCRELGNQRRFGGFPSIPGGVAYA
jgi:lambda family phage minor tail protein L